MVLREWPQERERDGDRRVMFLIAKCRGRVVRGCLRRAASDSRENRIGRMDARRLIDVDCVAVSGL